MKRVSVLSALLLLVGCNSIVRDLDTANLNSTCKPWDAFQSNIADTNGRTKRWPIEHELIPVEMPTAETDRFRVESALVKIEKQLRGKPNTVFLRDGDPQRRGYGLVVSMRTACTKTPGQTACGNVSRAPGDCALPFPNQEHPNDRLYNSLGELNGLLWINIDAEDGKSPPASEKCILHEFGHALGLMNHFPGFNDGKDSVGPPISEHFWDVLKTLYSHTPKTKREDLQPTARTSFLNNVLIRINSSNCEKGGWAPQLDLVSRSN